MMVPMVPFAFKMIESYSRIPGTDFVHDPEAGDMVVATGNQGCPGRRTQ